MGLSKLIIDGFKSYGGRYEVPFDGTPFVSVVGPNGSGKSNLLDAICFVIGMSPSQLRCKSFEELSHDSGSSKMSVTAIVTNDNGTNTFVFKRTPKAFFVDDKEVGEEEYASTWANINIVPNARNCVVLQGDIETLASADADSLAGFIESLNTNTQTEQNHELAEFAQLEKELSEASNDTRKNTALRKSAQAQADEALELTNAGERLAALRSKLRALEKRRRSLALAEKRAALESMRRKVDEAHSQVESYRTEAELVDSDSKKLRADYARKRRQLQAARNSEQEAHEALIIAEANLVPVKKKSEALETEERLLEPDLEYAQQSIKSTQKEVDAAQRALNMLERAHDNERARDGDETSDVDALSKELRDEWMRLETEFTTATALQQDQLDEVRRQATLTRQKYESKARRVEDLVAELSAMDARLQQKKMRLQQLNVLVEERTTQQEQRHQELAGVADELLSLRAEQRDLTNVLKELNNKVRVADGNRRALAQRHKLLDAVERLRRSHKGAVFDLLGNLVECTESKYAGAVDRGLGSQADAIVVDTAETAINCVAQARRERLGNLHFLPLADLQSWELGSARAQVNRKVSEGKEARLLVDCVEIDRRFRPAALYALGDSVYVPTFADGLSLRRSGLKMRIIDANGSVISTNNIMSSSTGESSLSSASDRTLAAMQRKARNVAEKMKINVSRETELRDAEIRLSAQIDRSVQTIEGAEKEVGIAEEQLRETQAALANLEKVLSEEREASSDLKSTADRSQEALDSFLRDLNSIKAEKFAPFISKAGGTLAEWDARFARGAQRSAEFSRQRQRLSDRLQLAVERHDAASAHLSKQKQRSKVLQSSLQQTTSQLSLLEEDAHTARQKLERAQARLRTLRSETESKSDEVGTAESALDSARARLVEAERQEHLHSLALSAEFGDEVDDEAERSDDGENDHSMGTSSEDEADRSGSKRKRTSARARKNKADKDTLSIDRLDARINDLRAEIEPLVQLSATLSGRDQDEAATEASRKCDELDKTAEAARARLQELASTFSQLKERRTAQFNDALTKLQACLSSIYLELAGGDAQATLTPLNSDEPYKGVELTVMPPGKSFVPVSQLSGGERSMAALALLFACQRIRPSPFVLLDEVDAALDFANVSSVSRYVKMHSSETQFILVSLKQRLFQSASHLVGVYKQQVQSHLLTVAL